MQFRLPKKPRHHKGKELGYARFAGKQVYLGHWPKRQKQPPPAVLAAFKAAVNEFLEAHPQTAAVNATAAAPSATANGSGTAAAARRVRSGAAPLLSVHEIWQRYHAHCLQYYRKDGVVTSEVGCIVMACRIVARLYGNWPAAHFGAAELLAVRAEMVRAGWVRESINKQVSRVRGMFKWAAKIEQGRLIPMSVFHELCEVEALEAGRCEAPEGEGQCAVDMGLVERTKPLLSEIVRAMVEVHYALGCRSQDLVVMRPCDLDRQADPSGKMWLYRSTVKKTRHHDKKGTRRTRDAQKLVYWVNAKAQAILAPLILKAGGFDSQRYVFSTGGIRGVRSDSLGRYTTGTYRQHVVRACDQLYPAPGMLARQLTTIRTRGGRSKQRLETEKERLARLSVAQRAELCAWRLEHGWTPYQLRHTRLSDIAAAALRAGGGGTEAAQRIAQHKHLSTTEIYAERNQEEARRIMERFG